MMSLRRVGLGSACIGGLLLLSSCAWTQRENRPVWNAFEASMVPDSEGIFYATLPITVPVGLGAILVDTFIAHPLQVVDEAWDDTCGLWRRVDFEQRYYTEGGFLPFRAAATPLLFLASFLGRSMIDWPSTENDQRWQARHRQQTLAWLGGIARGDHETRYRRLIDPVDDELVAAVRAALAGAAAVSRIRVYQAVSNSPQPMMLDWHEALADASAVVRFSVIEFVPEDFTLSDDVRRNILNDPDEAVRERAHRRWGQ